MVVRIFEPPEFGADTNTGLDNRRRTAGTQRDGHTRARGITCLVWHFDVHDVNRYVEDDIIVDEDHSTVATERQVERHVGVGDLTVAAIEVRRDALRLFPTGIEHARQVETLRTSHRRQLDIDHTIDHDDARTIENRNLSLEVSHSRCKRDCWPERQRGELLMRCITPRIVTLCWIPVRLDPIECNGSARNRRVDRRRRRRHDWTPVRGRSGASSRSWLTKLAYPWSSRCRARVWSPDSTMRPSTSTCTKSGLM